MLTRQRRQALDVSAFNPAVVRDSRTVGRVDAPFDQVPLDFKP
jgi:hypothetical protein